VAAVEGAAALGLNRVVFESDSKVLVDALNSSSHEHMHLNPINKSK
jgi:hypothetical protein